MKRVGQGLIALPFILFVLAGLIFDTVDFLIAMAIMTSIAAPICLGGYLIIKADK